MTAAYARVVIDADLKLDQLYVVHAGQHNFDLAPHVRCVAAKDLSTEVG